MEYEYRQPEAAAAPGQVSASKIEKSEPFSASVREKLAAVLMYALAFAYVSIRWGDRYVILCVFTLGFVALTEYLHRDTPRTWESWVWLGCMAACLLSLVLLDGGRVWGERTGDANTYWFLHIFAVWWVLSRSGALLEGESGRLLPLDALNGFVVFPFRHFLLRLRCVWAALTGARRGGRKTEAAPLVAALLAAVLAAWLLVTAARLLIAADTGFAELYHRFASLLHIEWDEELLLRLFFSLPVGAYLFGLLAGTAREEKGALRARAARIDAGLAQLRQVPPRVWTVLCALFCALYLVFFALQGRYLFGAFTHSLPEGFIVSQYARQGFFELCKVMALNFALLWLIVRTARSPVRTDRITLSLCLLLLGESLLFAVVALSKLGLYISDFGFTPRRLQSTWLVCVLAFGCLCAAFSLLRGKKTFRVWMIFGAVTLCSLCLY